MSDKDYRGFSENLDFYYIDDFKYNLKQVKGLKPKQLSKQYLELVEKQNGVVTAEDQANMIDEQDAWVKDVLETYLEFDYDTEVENFDLAVLRKMGAEIFNFLMIAGTTSKEHELSKKQYGEMQKFSKKTQS